jgi:epoxide hydrolase-like predicted phosphatase
VTIRGIIFDYGGVILDMRWDIARDLARDHGLTDRALVETLYGNNSDWHEIERGRGDRERWLAESHARLEKLGAKTLPPLHRHWSERQHLIRPTIELIGRLRPSYRTALLSNADLTLRERLTEFGLDGLFDAVVVSADVGMAKPEPEIYELAAQRLGLAAGECVFVDDLERNLEAARSVGMQAIHFRVDLDHDLEHLLAELGVRPEHSDAVSNTS